MVYWQLEIIVFQIEYYYIAVTELGNVHAIMFSRNTVERRITTPSPAKGVDSSVAGGGGKQFSFFLPGLFTPSPHVHFPNFYSHKRQWLLFLLRWSIPRGASLI